MKVLLNVVIPFYNVEKYFKACLDSLINQTEAFDEFVRVNDGSTDDSGNIAKKVDFISCDLVKTLRQRLLEYPVEILQFSEKVINEL